MRGGDFGGGKEMGGGWFWVGGGVPVIVGFDLGVVRWFMSGERLVP